MALTTTALILLTVVVGTAISTALIAHERDAAVGAAKREKAAADNARIQKSEAMRQTTIARTMAQEAKRERQRAEENFRKAREAVDRHRP